MERKSKIRRTNKCGPVVKNILKDNKNSMKLNDTSEVDKLFRTEKLKINLDIDKFMSEECEYNDALDCIIDEFSTEY